MVDARLCAALAWFLSIYVFARCCYMPVVIFRIWFIFGHVNFTAGDGVNRDGIESSMDIVEIMIDGGIGSRGADCCFFFNNATDKLLQRLIIRLRPQKIGDTHCLGHVETWSGDEKSSGLLDLLVMGSIAWHLGIGVSICCTNINELLWSIFTMLHWCIELVLQYWTSRLCLRTLFTNKTQEQDRTFIYQIDWNGILCHIIQAGIRKNTFILKDIKDYIS